jgi:tetratricopeptide (TPR) repeat protein
MVTLILVSFSVNVFGQKPPDLKNPRSLFYLANGYYQKHEYQKALDLYLQMISIGYRSGNLYYNLGNTYYKLGQRGMAVFNYEKAQRLIPADADLKANLAYMKDKSDDSKGPWYHEFNHYLSYLATPDQLLVIGSIFFFLLIGLIIYLMLFPQRIRNGENRLKPIWLTGLLVFGIVLIFTAAVAALTIREQYRPQAVMIRGSAEVRFEPNPGATLYYQLKEGAKVYIAGEKDNWLLIKRPDGKRGWVEKKYLEKI